MGRGNGFASQAGFGCGFTRGKGMFFFGKGVGSKVNISLRCPIFYDKMHYFHLVSDFSWLLWCERIVDHQPQPPIDHWNIYMLKCLEEHVDIPGQSQEIHICDPGEL